MLRVPPIRFVSSMDVDQDPEPVSGQLSEEQQDDAISQFINITGVNPERGKLYLTNTGWDLDLAIASYFEEADETAEELVSQNDRIQVEEELAAAAQATPNLFTPPVMDNSPAEPKKEPKRRGIATLGSLRNNDESDDDSDKQAFYAGGSDRSGQQVLGPAGSKKQDPDKLVKEMFSSAKEHGGQVVDPSEATTRTTRAERFVGQGFRLGSELGEPSEPVLGAASSSSRPTQVDMVLKLWRNGFSIDDGVLRDYNDPANAEFLKSIKKGEIPKEIVDANRAEVNLNMEDHREEEYVAVKKAIKAFTGEGQRLGNVTPATSSSIPVSSSAPDLQSAQQLMEVNESRPVTSIQIRLSDGTRMVMKVNTDQKVRRIREFICAARPGEAFREFELMTTFPNKVIENEDETVEQANLKNASVVQKLV